MNHYKWIVWKLACYERCYPSKSLGKLCTIFNVLEELKYRYLNQYVWYYGWACVSNASMITVSDAFAQV